MEGNLRLRLRLRLLLLLGLLALLVGVGAGAGAAPLRAAEQVAGAAYAVEEKAAVLVTSSRATASVHFTNKGTASTTGTRSADFFAGAGRRGHGAAGELPRSSTSTTTTAITGVTAKSTQASTTDLFDTNLASMATAVALFCRRALHPASPCCDHLVSSVDNAGVYRLTIQPQLILARLNASRLLALYANCQAQAGASPPAVPILAQPPPLLSRASPTAAFVMLPTWSASKLSAGGIGTCDFVTLSHELTDNCNVDKTVPAPSCCVSVLKAIDHEDQGCLCRIMDYGGFDLSHLSIHYMWDTYTQCGGKKQKVPKDTTSCEHAPSPPPPPPPPASPSPPNPKDHEHYGLSGLAIAGIVLGIILVVSLTVAAAVVLYHKLKTTAEVPVVVPLANIVPQELAVEVEVQEHAPAPDGDLEMVAPAATPPPTGPPPPLPRVIKPPPPLLPRVIVPPPLPPV